MVVWKNIGNVPRLWEMTLFQVLDLREIKPETSPSTSVGLCVPGDSKGIDNKSFFSGIVKWSLQNFCSLISMNLLVDFAPNQHDADQH